MKPLLKWKCIENACPVLAHSKHFRLWFPTQSAHCSHLEAPATTGGCGPYDYDLIGLGHGLEFEKDPQVVLTHMHLGTTGLIDSYFCYCCHYNYIQYNK